MKEFFNQKTKKINVQKLCIGKKDLCNLNPSNKSDKEKETQANIQK